MKRQNAPRTSGAFCILTVLRSDRFAFSPLFSHAAENRTAGLQTGCMEGLQTLRRGCQGSNSRFQHLL